MMIPVLGFQLNTSCINMVLIYPLPFRLPQLANPPLPSVTLISYCVTIRERWDNPI